MRMTIRSLGETERLLLRSPSEDDLDSIVDLWTDPLVTKYIGGPRDRDMVLDYFRDYADNPKATVRKEKDRWWSVIERSTGDFIGLCGLTEKEVEGQPEIDLGYFLLLSYWDKGYATEAAQRLVEYAFLELQLESIIAVIDPINVASKSVALKLGMELECASLRSDGVIRQVYRLKR
jgi:ribosomal-protein-alanine N-acetyltransferase